MKVSLLGNRQNVINAYRMAQARTLAHPAGLELECSSTRSGRWLTMGSCHCHCERCSAPNGLFQTRRFHYLTGSQGYRCHSTSRWPHRH